MRIEDELARFVVSPVMIIIGTRDAANRPNIGRGMGARIVDSDAVEIVLSSLQWPETVANLRDNGRMAVTFARPSDYVSYQLKGRARLRDADAADLARARHYAGDIRAVLEGLGLAQELLLPWFSDRKVVIAQLKVEEVYVQTPGPKAGTTVGAAT
jgi:hypothetical protein